MMLNSKLSSDSVNLYGDTTTGVSYRFVVTDLDDNKYVTVGTQKYQQSYNSLQLPYALLGIGRSNNYIETFYAATSYHGEPALRMWTPIIPQS